MLTQWGKWVNVQTAMFNNSVLGQNNAHKSSQTVIVHRDYIPSLWMWREFRETDVNRSARSERVNFRETEPAYSFVWFMFSLPFFPLHSSALARHTITSVTSDDMNTLAKLLEPYVGVCSFSDKEGFHSDVGSRLCHLCNPDDHLHHKLKSTRRSGAPTCFGRFP